VLSPDGRTLHTGNFVGNSISAYAVTPEGTLSLLGTAPRRETMMPDTKDIEVSPDGKHLSAIGPWRSTWPSSRSGRTACRASCPPVSRRTG
jgi:hypothetical protein